MNTGRDCPGRVFPVPFHLLLTCTEALCDTLHNSRLSSRGRRSVVSIGLMVRLFWALFCFYFSQKVETFFFLLLLFCKVDTQTPSQRHLDRDFPGMGSLSECLPTAGVGPGWSGAWNSPVAGHVRGRDPRAGGITSGLCGAALDRSWNQRQTWAPLPWWDLWVSPVTSEPPSQACVPNKRLLYDTAVVFIIIIII